MISSPVSLFVSLFVSCILCFFVCSTSAAPNSTFVQEAAAAAAPRNNAFGDRFFGESDAAFPQNASPAAFPDAVAPAEAPAAAVPDAVAPAEAPAAAVTDAVAPAAAPASSPTDNAYFESVLRKNHSVTAPSDTASFESAMSDTAALSENADFSETAASPESIYNENLSASQFGQCDGSCFKSERNVGMSCAFVSSAGSLLSAQLGSIIDKNDAIIRTAFAPVDGYQSHVGSRTTARYTWADASHPLLVNNGNERLIFLLQSRTDNRFQCRDMLAFYRRRRGSNLSLRCFLVDYDDTKIIQHPGWATGSFTAGMWSIAILGQACDSVTAYGVRFTPDSAPYPYHYYENWDKTEAESKAENLASDPAAHHFAQESRLYRDNSKCLCYAGAAGTIFFDVKKLAAVTAWIGFRAYDEKSRTYGSTADGLDDVRAAFRATRAKK